MKQTHCLLHNETEVDVFLKFPCFFYDPKDVGNLISGSPAFSKSSLNIWKFLVHVPLKPHLENFEHYFASMWVSESRSVVSDSLRPRGLYNPWTSPGHYTGVGSLSLLQVASMWDECNCEVVWAFFGIAFLWDWNENWPFPVLWPLPSFPNLQAYWVQHFISLHLLGFEIVQV